jgi:NADH:ubiquinone oxidoreductase subunit F (NADH-binding)
MTQLIHRVLDSSPCPDLDTYLRVGGGFGLENARRLGQEAVLDHIEAAGLRGRGGAGFPAGTKWRTVAESQSSTASTSVVVNGAEGEPGTFKDRLLLRSNPYKVLEGALIAAVAVDARQVVICLKHSFAREIATVGQAIRDLTHAGWAPEVQLRMVLGPSSYLFGEETALLEVVNGRQPFPRVDPPFRRGVDPAPAGVGHSASRVHLASLGGSDAPPALVNNVETMANVPGILSRGVDWYRSIGTERSPGSLLCTITGHTRRHAVGEIPMGTPLRHAIELIGGGPRDGRSVVAVLSGVANPIIPDSLLDTPLTFEDMASVGTGLGAGGFIVFQDGTDLFAVAHAVAQFLAVESCGQCEPCKRDGLAISHHLAALRRGSATERDLDDLNGRLATVTRGARCSLASQQERVVGSILSLFRNDIPSDGGSGGAAFVLPLVDIVHGRAVLDTSQLLKQPDWTHDARDSGSWPAARLGNQPIVLTAPSISEDMGARPMDAAASTRPAPGELVNGLREVHNEILSLVSQAALAEPTDQPGALRALDDRLRAHIDVTRRVLYPMVQRVAGDEGDIASSTAEHAERDGLRLVELLTRASAASTATDMQDVARAVRAHVEAEQHEVLPLLLDRLDTEQLDDLADALNEARLRVQPSTGGHRREQPPQRREAS